MGRKLIPHWPWRFICDDPELSKRIVALGLIGLQCQVGTQDGHGYYEFMEWIDSKHNDRRIDRMTRSALGHAWIYGWGINDESKDKIMSSDEEWEESGYENPPNGDSILEPYVDAHNKKAKPSKRNFHISKTENIIPKEVPPPPPPRSSYMNDRHPNKKVCKVEKLKVIKYSVGDSEEFLP
ncbi:hypothetical protein Tco_0635099 [Tanacetum coccineum]